MSDTTPFEHPDRIGPYHILQVIGESSMGVVRAIALSASSSCTMIGKTPKVPTCLALLLALAACGGGDGGGGSQQPTAPEPAGPVPVASVVVSPSSTTLEIGQTAQLTATVTDAGGNLLSGRTIAWSSSSQAVATVGAAGLVTAVGPGVTTLTATSEGRSGTAAATVVAPVAATWIDTHAHPTGNPGEMGACFDPACLDRTVARQDAHHVVQAVMMSPPSPVAAEAFEAAIKGAVSSRSDRFAFAGGGRSINPLLHESVLDGLTLERSDALEAAAAQFALDGAVAFGELTALHLSSRPMHPFMEAPPDHPAFLLLADLAAQHGLPVDLHMEALVTDKPTPPLFLQLSAANPASLNANIDALERLLSHNRAARIVWAHIGRDNTGDMTVELLGRLLEAHPNLFLQVLTYGNIVPLFPEHAPLDEGGSLRPEWLALFTAFPDRFVLGSDAFYALPDGVDSHLEPIDALLQALPPDLARLIGLENPRRIYDRL